MIKTKDLGQPSSKGSLFFQKADDDKYSLVNDEISNLINIPAETYLPLIAKVSTNSNFKPKHFYFLELEIEKFFY